MSHNFDYLSVINFEKSSVGLYFSGRLSIALNAVMYNIKHFIHVLVSYCCMFYFNRLQ